MGKTLSLEYPIYKRTPRKSYVNRVKEQIRCRDAYTLGLTGRGVCVAVLDTGAYPTGILRTGSRALRMW